MRRATVKHIRPARPEDYDAIIAVVDEWWGRSVMRSLPRLYLDHFSGTSFVAEDESGLAGFIIGFVSPTQPDVAYCHFIAVRPDRRGSKLGGALYAELANVARDAGCTELRAITPPFNEASIGFHQRLGFEASGPVADYNGPGTEAVTLTMDLHGREAVR